MIFLCLLAGCQGKTSGPLILRDALEYRATLAEVQKLTQAPFEAMHEGHPISDGEKKDLQKADKLIDGLIAFKSDGYGPYILKGLTQRALGNAEAALRAYQQGLALAPANPKPDDKEAIARIHDEMASFYFDQHDLKNADIHAQAAIQLMPSDPSLLTDAASIKIQLGQVKEAGALLQNALKIQPDYARAKELTKLIKMAQ